MRKISFDRRGPGTCSAPWPGRWSGPDEFSFELELFHHAAERGGNSTGPTETGESLRLSW